MRTSTTTQKKTKRTKSTQPQLTPLTTEEVRALPKAHTGFDAFIEPLAGLVRDYPNDLGTGIDVDSMRAAVTAYQALSDARAEAAKRLALIDDTRLLHSSSAWATELLIYNRAQSAARTNPAIRRAIEDFARFMKHTKKKGTKVPPSTT